MQAKPVTVLEELDQDASQLNSEAMNSMMMQFVHMQNMIGGSPSSWNLSMSDGGSYQHSNISQPGYHQDPYSIHQPLPGMNHGGSGFNMNVSNVQQANRGSGNSRAGQDDDAWSTRPRARGHISKNDLIYIGEDKYQPKAQGNFDLNILKSVEGLLDDDPDTDKFDSGFMDSNFTSNAKTKVRSVENSGFGTMKNNSGWSDTTASKFNKTRKSGNDSVPNSFENKVTRSFGESKMQEPKLISELSTIFENKEGLFFSWQRSGQTERRTDSKQGSQSHCEGFKLIGDPIQNKDLVSSGILRDEKHITEPLFYSNFYSESNKSRLDQPEQQTSKHSIMDEYTSKNISKNSEE